MNYLFKCSSVFLSVWILTGMSTLAYAGKNDKKNETKKVTPSAAEATQSDAISNDTEFVFKLNELTKLIQKNANKNQSTNIRKQLMEADFTSDISSIERFAALGIWEGFEKRLKSLANMTSNGEIDSIQLAHELTLLMMEGREGALVKVSTLVPWIWQFHNALNFKDEKTKSTFLSEMMKIDLSMSDSEASVPHLSKMVTHAMTVSKKLGARRLALQTEWSELKKKLLNDAKPENTQPILTAAEKQHIEQRMIKLKLQIAKDQSDEETLGKLSRLFDILQSIKTLPDTVNESGSVNMEQYFDDRLLEEVDEAYQIVTSLFPRSSLVSSADVFLKYLASFSDYLSFWKEIHQIAKPLHEVMAFDASSPESQIDHSLKDQNSVGIEGFLRFVQVATSVGTGLQIELSGINKTFANKRKLAMRNHSDVSKFGPQERKEKEAAINKFYGLLTHVVDEFFNVQKLVFDMTAESNLKHLNSIELSEPETPQKSPNLIASSHLPKSSSAPMVCTQSPNIEPHSAVSRSMEGVSQCLKESTEKEAQSEVQAEIKAVDYEARIKQEHEEHQRKKKKKSVSDVVYPKIIHISGRRLGEAWANLLRAGLSQIEKYELKNKKRAPELNAALIKEVQEVVDRYPSYDHRVEEEHYDSFIRSLSKPEMRLLKRFSGGGSGHSTWEFNNKDFKFLNAASFNVAQVKDGRMDSESTADFGAALIRSRIFRYIGLRE